MTAPPVITITEQSRYGDGFHATVEVTGDPRRHEVTVRDPADDAGRELFRWYFERFQACPFFRSARREEAERALSAYGVALFTQVFADRPDHHRGADRLIVSGTAAFHRLHWEMMRDPGDDQPLSVRMPLERHTRPEAEYRPLPPGPSLNVLVVAARPFGDDDPHTISRTLVTAAGHTPRPPLRVSLSRPGTWAALHESLEGQRYQAIHLDLHGEVLDHAALRDGIGIGRLEPSSAITPYQGEQAFLFFETRADGVADPVPAAAVARLLRENRLTVAMLNACRPAGAGVAQRLAAAGVPVVVGMAYPPTTAAAARVVPDFYRRLAAGDTPREPVREVRRGLFHHPGRTTLFIRTVILRDWMLSVYYHQQEVTVCRDEMN